MKTEIDLGNIPFYWRIKKNFDEGPKDIPSTLPFVFSYDSELELIKQKENKEIFAVLDRVYKEDSNVGYLQEGGALASSYGGEFVQFFIESLSKVDFNPKNIADIGCGGVYLLNKLRDKGFKVKGIDPSPVTKKIASKYNIEIIQDFYPSKNINEKFDILFHYDVLEHISDPISFLSSHKKNLNDKGAIIFAVPDCTSFIEKGDASMMLHEHLNYFDKDSLNNVVTKSGFNVIDIKRAKYGGVLYCFCVNFKCIQDPFKKEKKNNKFLDFSIKLNKNMIAFSSLFKNCYYRDVGLYIPLRAYPYIHIIPKNTNLRFFNDDPSWHKHFLDGFKNPVENLSDLLEDPPELLIICSFSFGKKIAERIPTNVLNPSNIILWSDIFKY